MAVPVQTTSRRPYLLAGVVFAVLITLISVLVLTFDLSESEVRGALFATTMICVVLICKSVFDTAVTEEFSLDLKKSYSDKLVFASRELYTELYQNSPVPYFLIGLSGEVRSANLAAYRLLSLNPGYPINLNIFEHLTSDEPQHFELLIEKYRNKISVSNELVRVKVPKDREMWALLSLFTFTSVREPLGLLTLVDITKQKQIENAKSEFVSLASHQLRTPIAGIKWSAELLQMDNSVNLTVRQHKYIDRLLASTARMSVLVDDFLRVSRFELGTFQPEYSKVNLSELITDIVAEHTGRLEQKKIRVKTFFAEELPVVINDQDLLRMIITNLFSNSVKYTKEQGTIHVGFTKKDEDILITVSDNGMGIPIADQDRVFDKLFRASNAVRQVPDGTGLGLYIVKEAVRVLGGSVTFTSIENESTTFEVVLPIKLSIS
jgi:two-component system phosphate regulon sensor histidine kinase PhoR